MVITSPRYMGVAASMWVLMSSKNLELSPNDHPNRAQVRPKGFENATRSPKQGQFCHGAHGPGYIRLAATTLVPTGA